MRKEAIEAAKQALIPENNYVFEFRFSADEHEWKVPRQCNNNLGYSLSESITRLEAIQLLRGLADLLEQEG